jgi:NADH dehydrogenase
MANPRSWRLAVLLSAAAGCALALAMRRTKAQRASRRIPAGRRILILGAGFGGRAVARELTRLIPVECQTDIRIVDHNDWLLFTPMLTEVAGGEIAPQHITSPACRLPSRIAYECARVETIDLPRKTVTLGDPAASSQAGKRTLSADHLVIALGSVPAFHRIDGVAEHTLPMKTLEDAAAVRDHVLNCMECAAVEPRADRRAALLTFVVGGGGYTGVETMAAVNDMVRAAAPRLRVDPAEIRTILIETGDRLLPEVTRSLGGYAHKKLEQRKVEVRLNTKIRGAGSDHVEVDGTRIATRTLIWAAGVKANPIVEHLACAHGKHGAIAVDHTCAIPGQSNVWALGDCAEVPHGGSQNAYAPTAQNATREGECVARNIVAVLKGEQARAFDYQPIGELALVGRHSGIARVYGLHFSGFLAWAAWRAFYLLTIPAPRQRARILLDWLRGLAFGRAAIENRQSHEQRRASAVAGPT